MSSSPIIAVIGGLNMDMVFETERMPDFGESMDTMSLAYYPGGKGANTAIATYRASHNKPDGKGAVTRQEDEKKNGDIRVFMNGTVGDDDFGVVLRTKLEEQGIDVSGVRTFEGEKSGTCAVIVDIFSGEARNLGYQGANLKWTPRDPDSVQCLAGGAKPDLVISHLGVPREQVERVLETASKNGVDTILNPSPAAYLISSTYQNVTHLLMNETESAMLSGRPIEEFDNLDVWKETAQQLIDLGVKNVVITLGAKGAYYATHKGETGLVDAEKNIKVMDTTGAGYVRLFCQFPVSRFCFDCASKCPEANACIDCRDTFVGTYAVEYIRHKQKGEWDIQKAIARACKASARTIERLGAQESIPWDDEIDPK
jgi:ribokinase